MRWNLHRLFLALLSLLAASWAMSGQDKVHLIKAKSAQLLEINGESYRKVTGPARFLHNDTYLLCDTALWNINTNIIDAVGHVRIIQDRTTLSSNTLQYVVDEDLARFRGELVELVDEEKNTLRTRYLDYNTKDSVAVFQNGGAMRDKDGQVIESLYGTYDSKAHLFVFNDQVDMYMDTTFIKTSRLEYRSDLSTAYFGFGTDMWQKDQMLSADDGWYDRGRELFMFRKRVHTLTPEKETWSDSAYYYRALGNVDLLGKVEVMDSVKNAYALAGRIVYIDSLNQATLYRDPAIMSVIHEEGQEPDSLYLGADTLLYRAIKRCDIPEPWVKDAGKRLSDIGGDPIMEYRRKAAEAAAKAAAEAMKDDPNMRNKMAGSAPKLDKPKKPAADTLASPADSLAVPVDTLAAPADTLPPPDTTKITFIWGNRNVKMFRRNMQMCGDSLAYSDLDSLARVYKDPIFFSDGNRQYAADSIYLVIRQKRIDKAHLLSNAFITIREDPVSYDQISGTEMVAYFDSTQALYRFDALGGASSLFYLEENGVLATVNKVESKMLYATFTDNEIDHIYYYDNPSNDGYPSVQLPKEDRVLKGYRWEPEKRPSSPEDVTLLKPRKSQRTSYLARPHTAFKQTDVYFPGYISKVYRDIAIRDSLEVARKLAAGAVLDSAVVNHVQDTVSALADSLSAAAGTSPASHAADSLVTPAATDSVSVQADTRSKAAQKALVKEQKKKAREAKWAEKDRKYEARQAAKAAKAQARIDAVEQRKRAKLERRINRERKLLEKYIEKERAKALKKKQTKTTT